MPIPELTESCRPPQILGPATLTSAAMRGACAHALLRAIDAAAPAPAARLFDTAIATQLGFRRDEALSLQQAALALSPLYRIRRAEAHRAQLRLLAVCIPGDLMANTPLDFITNHLDVRLDLLFVTADGALPPLAPEHDVAFFAASEADPALARTLRQLYAAWPRPVLNDPALLPSLRRDRLPRVLADIPGLLCPAAIAVSRATLQDCATHPHTLSGGAFPVLIRPLGSHAGEGLAKVDDAATLTAYVAAAAAESFHLGAFVDYRSGDGQYRKYRLAVIDGAPNLCHMAVSTHWMVHYMNAGMAKSTARRAEEARMMERSSALYARHARALAAMHGRLGLDYYAIDCAELQDGRLLVFEVDTAAIIHAMDPPSLFAYKQPQMRRVFDAFGAMLRKNEGKPGGRGLRSGNREPSPGQGVGGGAPNPLSVLNDLPA